MERTEERAGELWTLFDLEGEGALDTELFRERIRSLKLLIGACLEWC